MPEHFKSGKVPLPELMLRALRTYRHCFKYIAIIGVGIYLPVDIVVALVGARLDIASLMDAGIMGGDISGMYRFVAITLIIESAVMPLETAALTYFTRQRLENAEVSLDGALEAAFGNWQKLFITSLGYLSLVMMSSVLIVPALIFGVFFYFCIHIVVAGNIFGFKAIRESARIVKGHWWRTLGMLAFVNVGMLSLQLLLGSALAPVFNLIPSGMPNWIFSIAVSVALGILCIAFKIIIALYFFNLYYTARKREA